MVARIFTLYHRLEVIWLPGCGPKKGWRKGNHTTTLLLIPAARWAMRSCMQLRGYDLWGQCERRHLNPPNATISQTRFFPGEKVTQLNRTHCTFWSLESNWIYKGFLFWVSVTAFFFIFLFFLNQAWKSQSY